MITKPTERLRARELMAHEWFIRVIKVTEQAAEMAWNHSYVVCAERNGKERLTLSGNCHDFPYSFLTLAILKSSPRPIERSQ